MRFPKFLLRLADAARRSLAVGYDVAVNPNSTGKPHAMPSDAPTAPPAFVSTAPAPAPDYAGHTAAVAAVTPGIISTVQAAASTGAVSSSSVASVAASILQSVVSDLGIIFSVTRASTTTQTEVAAGVALLEGILKAFGI